MIRLIVFLLVIGAGAFGASWLVEREGVVTLVWQGWRIEATLPVFVLALATAIVLAVVLWTVMRGIWRLPRRLREGRARRRKERARHAITDGLIAIGTGDTATARMYAHQAKRLAPRDPLALLLDAQASQLSGDRDGARRAFQTMATRDDTRLLGLRGLFIEAQRNDDPLAAVAMAEEAVKISPSSPWASQAVLGFRCAHGDWSGALGILEGNHDAGLVKKDLYRRERAVLLTAQALDLAKGDRDRAREAAMEAVKLAPTLVPAAVLAAKFHAEDNQVRKAMRLVEAAWDAMPHPDLADAYAHVRLGDSARERLARIESLAARQPGDPESALAIARAAIDASEFARAREALAPSLSRPTQRAALLMAEIERAEYGDAGRAREWMLRAVHAAHDPAWTADGYVSEQWRPVSPVTGRLDAFQWIVPVAALPGLVAPVVPDMPPSEAAPMLNAPAEMTADDVGQDDAGGKDVGRQDASRKDVAREDVAREPAGALSATKLKPAEKSEPPAEPEAAPAARATMAAGTPPLFRERRDIDTARARAPVPAVIASAPIPDDPGVESDSGPDDHERSGQRGGWRGFLTRWVH